MPAVCCNWASTTRRPSVRHNWRRRFPASCCTYSIVLRPRPGQASPWPVAGYISQKAAGCIRLRCVAFRPPGQTSSSCPITMWWNCAAKVTFGRHGTASACWIRRRWWLAAAAEVKRFPPSADLPLKRIRGQITRLAQTEASQVLGTVVCAEGYIAPVRLGEHTLGASFNFKSDDLTPTVADHLDNLQLLQEISSDLVERLGAEHLPPEQLLGFAGFRCTSPDYLPIVGPLADRDAFLDAYAVLGKDARQVPDIPCPWLDGLYINSGHGSRGLITAPLSGELLAAWLDNEPLPLPRSVAEACHPNRFMLRGLIRGKNG